MNALRLGGETRPAPELATTWEAADLTVQLGAISHSHAGRDGLRCGCGTARRARWTWRKTHGRAGSVRASSMLLVRLRSHDSDAQPHALLSELRARLDCGRASGAEQSVNHRLNKGPPVAQLRVRRSPCAPIRQLRSFVGVQATLSSVNRSHALPQAAGLARSGPRRAARRPLDDKHRFAAGSRDRFRILNYCINVDNSRLPYIIVIVRGTPPSLECP